eukprot:gene16908-18614_t
MSGDKRLADLKLGASLNRLGIRTRGGASGSPISGRLPCLKPARDLTLGSSTPKRTFTPNIPARRAVKEESASQSSEVGSPRGGRRKHEGRGRGRERGRGRGRGGRGGRGGVVMSQGIFSQGPFALKRTVGEAVAASSYSSGGGRADGDGEGRSRTSVIMSSRGTGEDGNTTKRVLEMLSDSGRMEINEEEMKEGGLVPITIPLANPKLLNKHLEDVKKHASPSKYNRVKPEHMNDRIGLEESTKPKLANSNELQLSCDQLFSSNFTNDKLLFLQFPDAMPVKSLAQHENETRSDQSEAGPSSIQKLEEELAKFSLNNVSEGYIGKIRVHQSGNDLMSVHVDEERQDMSCLGRVDHRVICVPDFEELVGNATS